ncbi:uncharacterized protein FTOL_09474 [Fusarium torulosum]|uniref:RING-type domain-containing protein n=1 Tax=Fusarium torulosum TaxID=33205 RepID=A0AAE8SLK9_9HYPO|nr:uncharacterized protein FTOL_09474 [Fusarium torulosum]
MPINETYFPALMQILDQDPSAAERLGLQCPICMELMTIDTTDDFSGLNSHNAYVLPCKHIVGLSCIATLIVHNGETGTAHRCPTCRADLFHSGCQHPNIRGTIIRLSQACRAAVNISVLNSNRIDEFCVDCYVEYITQRLTNIAIDEFDFSNLVTGRRAVQLTYKIGGIVFTSLSFPRNATTIMELPILPNLRNATERAREYLAKLLGVPADKTAELEFCLTLIEINPVHGPDLLNELLFRGQREYMQDAAVALQRPGVTREFIANDSMLGFCRMMTFQQEINAQMRSQITRIRR